MTTTTVVQDAQGVLTKVEADVKWGVKYIAKETPIWATNLFRILYFLTKVATAWIAGTHLIPAEIKVEIGLFLNVVFDSLVWLITHMFGIKTDDLDSYTDKLNNQPLQQEPPQAQAL